MGELGRGEESEGGIKLFGAMIRVKVDGEVKKEKGEIKIEDQKRIACPRCKSMETKFCYFNNYNVNQPRHFCKSCQRYWTAGGALRNVPIGAGRRKGKSPCHVVAGDDENINNGLVMDEWHGDFRQIFPAKRPRTVSAAQHQGQ